MNDDISLLLDLFEQSGPEVRGHILSGLESEQIAMVERFIAGRCDAAELRDLSEFLKLHPAWIRWIADRVKMARDLGDGSVPSASLTKQMMA